MKGIFFSLLIVLSFHQTLLAAWDKEVCFSPSGDCDQKLVQFVLSAQKSIDVAIYNITLRDLTKALIEQSKKIKVRVVVDFTNSLANNSQVKELQNAGVDVRYGVQQNLFHHKFMVIDQAYVETGSFNFTVGATRYNQENQIYLSDPIIVVAFQEQFENIWQNHSSIEEQPNQRD